MDLTDELIAKRGWEDFDDPTDELTTVQDERLEQATDDLQYAIRWLFHMWATRDMENHCRWDSKKEWREYLEGGMRFPDRRPWNWECVYPWWKWPTTWFFWRNTLTGIAWLFRRWFCNEEVTHGLD